MADQEGAMPAWEFKGDDPLIIWMASDVPATNTALTANLTCRVLFGILANLVCLVPLRILWTNGEFAACVFIATVEIKNLLTVTNALIWRDNHVETWWPGYGFCDVVPYLQQFLTMLYVTALLAIMRNVCQQVGLLRANPLTAKEKRKRTLVQALIMFPLPLLQAAVMWLIQSQRFAVGTLVGCTFVGSQTWIYVVFFIVPPLVVAFVTVAYSILTYFRYRELAKTITPAFGSNRHAQSRADRTRRRLYLMVMSILVPFLPTVIALGVINVLEIDEIVPYDYDAIHNYTEPWTWNTIAFLRSTDFDWMYMHIGYIPIIGALPIFLFFGTTQDAMNDYRRVLLLFGLGKIFPKLYQEYDPDRLPEGSQASSNLNSISSSGQRTGKFSNFSLRHITLTSSNGATDVEMQSVHLPAKTTTTTDIESQRTPSSTGNVQIPPRNPWLLRTHLNFPHIPFPPFLRSRNHSRDDDTNTSQASLRSFRGGSQNSNAVQTRVWSNEDSQQRQDGQNAIRDQDGRSFDAEHVVVETQFVRETHQNSDAR